jgi:hypothetical protein
MAHQALSEAWSQMDLWLDEEIPVTLRADAAQHHPMNRQDS